MEVIGDTFKRGVIVAEVKGERQAVSCVVMSEVGTGVMLRAG